MIAGEICGSLGDAGFDRVASRVAKELLSQGVARALQLDRALKPVAAYEQAAVAVFIDIAGYSLDLYFFGAGQVAVPVAHLASEVGFRLHVMDTRPLFANHKRFPTASEVLVGFPGELAQGRECTEFSFALLLAHAAKHDLPVLEGLLRPDIRYIGVLGSARRAAALATRLREIGCTAGEIARLHLPVGLDIGAETAEQQDSTSRPPIRGSQSRVWRPHPGRASVGRQRCGGGPRVLGPDVCDCESLGLYAFRIP